jgi:hypothetical protein
MHSNPALAKTLHETIIDQVKQNNLAMLRHHYKFGVSQESSAGICLSVDSSLYSLA